MSPNPTLATFDAGSRSFCVVRRQKTNTPLQALVTLNDPTFIEAARVLGLQMTLAVDSKNAISLAYRKLTGHFPLPQEIVLLQKMYKTEYERFKTNPKKAAGWLHAGQYRINDNIDTAKIAANAVVASTILNSDASLTKR
nr:DUF1553 domain-containing protein [Dyadobacter sp. CY356]